MSPDPATPAIPPPRAQAPVEHPARPPGSSAPAGHHGPFHTHCENCGAALQGPWCHRCGQHDFEFHRSFGHVFMEALETIFHFEGKFFRNIVTLLFQPGRLTADFNAGRRAAQMPPFRLYIFVSFVFFLLVSIGGDKPGSGHLTVNTVAADSGQRVPAAETGPAALRDQAPPPPPAGIGELVEQLAHRLADPEKRHQLVHWIQVHIPHMMMLCLPLFALYTRALFRKSGLVYLQHLVVSVHYHTFVYLWVLFTRGWTALAGLPGWGLDGWVAFAGNAWLVVYPFVMLRRLFAGSWPKALFKGGLLALAYASTLALGFFLTAAIAFFIA